MKHRSATVTIEFPIPNWNREAFTDMLIEGKTIVPLTNRELLIDAPFLYSHESDVEEALLERFTPEWARRRFAAARRGEALLRKELRDEENIEKLLEGCDARSVFRHRFRREMREVRLRANMDIARCWVRLLKRRPEYVGRCPWHVFQGDRIWQTLQDGELLRAINCTPLQLAEKMDLNAMTSCDWDEAIKTVPELAARRPKHDCDCYVV